MDAKTLIIAATATAMSSDMVRGAAMASVRLLGHEKFALRRQSIEGYSVCMGQSLPVAPFLDSPRACLQSASAVERANQPGLTLN
jgi:hypothetical protein